MGPIAIDPSDGLVLLSQQGLFVERGSESGQEITPIDLLIGRPIDLEIIDNKGVVTTSAGDIFPETARKDLTAVGPMLEEVVDMEPVGDGYLMLDRYGRVQSYGTDAHYEGTVYRQEVKMGGFSFLQDLPIAIDLEAVGNQGYYILDAQGGFFAAGNVPALPAVSEDYGLNLTGDTGAVAADLVIDAAGNVTGYHVLLQTGEIVTWDGAAFSSTAISVRETATGPQAVDFVVAEGDFYVMNELGEVYGPEGLVNDPAAFGNTIGKLGFYDIEYGIVVSD